MAHRGRKKGVSVKGSLKGPLILNRRTVHLDVEAEAAEPPERAAVASSFFSKPTLRDPWFGLNQKRTTAVPGNVKT